MTLKHLALVCGAVACLNTISAMASPWIAPGDVQARYALQKLADRGHLDRTVSTWPFLWSNVGDSLGAAATGDPGAGAGPVTYLRAQKRSQFENGTNVQMTVAGATEPGLVQGFGTTAREEGELSVGVEWQQGHWAAGIKPTVVINPTDNEEYRFDGSYLAGNFGNLVFGAGAIDQWWGPGWQSSLILSNNARPIPSVWLTRKNDFAPSTSWLEWVGPWNFTVFAGQLEKERVVPDTKLMGMRLTLRPITGLDVGFSRIVMWGGEGRPETGSSLWDALIGRDNSQDGGSNDPSNQLGSIDLRYGFGVGRQAMGVYMQMLGEDEAGAFPAKKSWLLGVDWTTQLLAAEQQWFIEYTNTLADDFLGDAVPNVTYEHFNYRTGYRHYGRGMGASIGGDANASSIGLYQFFNAGSRLGFTASYVQLNRNPNVRASTPGPDVNYYIPTKRQELMALNLSYGTSIMANGWLEFAVQGTSEAVELLGGEQNRLSAGVEWRYAF